MRRETYLGVSVASLRIAYVLMTSGRVKEWKKSRKATTTVPRARSYVRIAIEKHKPTLVVIEDPNGKTRKQGRSLEILHALSQDLKENGRAHILIDKLHHYTNKYEEAVELAEGYPELKSELPEKPKFYENEPPKMAYFEALSLIDGAIRAENED